MAEKERAADNLELIGGRLCLDFANTVSTRLEGGREYLTGYAELAAWGQHAGALTGYEAEVLLAYAAQHPEQAAAALGRAIAAREVIYRVFSAIAAGCQPEAGDLSDLNLAWHEALARLEVVPGQGGFEWRWALDGGDLERVLWPVIRSATDLLTSPDLGRVRECARPGCDWLFVDSSKNRSRRWCSMVTCGSRVKARRYYRRVRTSKEGQA